MHSLSDVIQRMLKIRCLLRVILLPFLFCIVPVYAYAGTAAIHLIKQMLNIEGAEYPAYIPEGYRLDVMSIEIDAPRMMTFTPDDDLLIGSKSGNIYKLEPPYNKAQTLLELDNYPHSVIVKDGLLYIAQTDGLYVTRYKADQKRILPENVKRLLPLPGGGGHNSRTVRLGPDGKIYLALGIRGNCSDEYLGASYEFNLRRGGIFVLNNLAKPSWQTYGSGLRNPVGFAWHPVTGVMYASNNGPDHHGFERPPEYFSRVDPGSFHGMPWFQYDGLNIVSDDCIDSDPPLPADKVSIPVAVFPARNAPMGVEFVDNARFGQSLLNDAVVALRGSWATKPGGGFFGAKKTRRKPKLVVVRFNKGKALRVDDLVTGFQLEDGSRWARPVGVIMGPDGALYFTSDSGVNGLFRLRKLEK